MKTLDNYMKDALDLVNESKKQYLQSRRMVAKVRAKLHLRRQKNIGVPVHSPAKLIKHID